MCLNEIGLHAHNLLSIVGSIVINIRAGTYMGIFDELEDLRFDNVQDIHISSEDHEENSFGPIQICQSSRTT